MSVICMREPSSFGLGARGEDADLALLEVAAIDRRQGRERPRRDRSSTNGAYARADRFDLLDERVGDLRAGLVGDDRHPFVRLDVEADTRRRCARPGAVLINDVRSSSDPLIKPFRGQPSSPQS